MPAGRPRERIPEKEELISLGKDLLEWAEGEPEKGEHRNRWCDWYSIRHFFISSQWKLMVQKPEFRPYYEKAQSYLGNRWIYGDINPSISHRFLRVYCLEMKEDEDELKEKANEKLALEQLEMLAKFFGTIQEARKIANIKTPKEYTSA